MAKIRPSPRRSGPNVPQNETSKPLAPPVRARQLLAHAVQHLGVGLQVGVADLAVQLDHLLQLGDCPVELPLSAVWVVATDTLLARGAAM